jgi:hypothetical protein
MATAGTLLSDLDSKLPVSNNKDDDLVNKILADMNIPMSGGNKIIQTSNPNSTYQVAMDPATATAHMIGKDYPTAADFSNAMHTPNFSHSPYQPPMPMQPTIIMDTKGNYYTEIITQLKQPLLVAIIIFLVSLPALNVLLGYYLPSLLRLGGDLTTMGLVVKSLVGGFLFWFIQKVLVPLMVL